MLTIREDISDREPSCGAIKSPLSDRTPVCELPRGHTDQHLGRSRAGRWYSWPWTQEQIPA